MKTLTISRRSEELDEILAEAFREDLIVRNKDGHEFMIVAIEDFDQEIIRQRKNQKLMAALDELGRQPATSTLEEFERELGTT